MSGVSQNSEPSAREAAGMVFMALGIGLREPIFRKRLLWGFALNGLAFCAFVAVLLWGAFGWVDGMLSANEQPDPGWLMSVWYWARDGLGMLLKAVAFIATLLLSPVLFNLLAAALLPALHGHIFGVARTFAGGKVVQEGGRNIFAEMVSVLGRLFRFLCLSLCLLPLLLLPGGSVIYLLGQFLLTARALGWEILAHHLELHGMDNQRQRQFMGQRAGLVTGVGAAAALLAMVPVVQMFAITTNVIAAGMLSARLDT
jgi:uncharacterized protein involved in cysteine biosynthesis